MEEDEIIIDITRSKVSNNKKKQNNTKRKNEKPSKKAVNKTALVNKKRVDKNKKKNIKKINKKKISPKKAKIFGLTLLIIISFVLLFSSNIFDIKEIVVENNSKISKEQIISFSNINKGSNIFAINKLKGISDIKENSYIESVKIKRILPNTIMIEIKERVPEYVLQYAESYVYINNQGYILEISNEILELPIIDGFTLEISEVVEGGRINNADLKKLNQANIIMSVAKANEIGLLVSKIDVSNDKNYTLVLESEEKIAYLGDCSQLNTRMLYLKSILEAEKGRSGEIFINVDLNNDDVFFKDTTSL